MAKLLDEEFEKYELLKSDYDVAFGLKEAFLRIYGQQDEDIETVEKLYVDQTLTFKRLSDYKKQLFEKYFNNNLPFIDNNIYINIIDKEIWYRYKGVMIDG